MVQNVGSADNSVLGLLAVTQHVAINTKFRVLEFVMEHVESTSFIFSMYDCHTLFILSHLVVQAP